MTLPDIRIQNTGAAQSNVPFTFGQVFAVGDLMPGEGLAGKLADGSTIPLQVDQKVTHGDGSVRHAIISGVLPTLAKGATAKFDLVKAKADTGGFALPAPSFSVAIAIDGLKYTASQAVQYGVTSWLSGAIVYELYSTAPLFNSAGVEHPLLTARFGVRQYAGGQTRVEVIVENTSTFKAPARNFTYDVSVEVGGKVVYSKTALTHYHHARWHMYAWAGAEPAIHVQHNAAYLIASKAVSNYDQSLTIPDWVLGDLRSTLPPEKTGPMTVGTCVESMGTTGGRPDIGPLPNYSVFYLLTGDIRAREVMMANADGSGSWSMHYRDENTGYPVRTDNAANKRLSTHMNMQGSGPLPMPRFEEGADHDSPFGDDVAHHPSLAYLPYLLTGDLYYLEELQFWAASNSLATDPGNSGEGLGLLRWHQIRGQAWAMRTLGHAAYITPDASPLKAYFTKQLQNNLDFYTQIYVIGNPNKLGVYDGSGDGSMEAPASAPWQDDFFTWSFGYLLELGFDNARPMLEWKSKYPIGRLTAPGFCWIAATAYTLQDREVAGGPVVDTFAKLYQLNFGGDTVRADWGGALPGPAGKKYIDLPCGSKEQADYLDTINGNYGWPVGKMMGYSDSPLGYAANMQPGLSVAVTVNADGPKAWQVFVGRAAKPDYAINPQWNIIPRTAVAAPPVVVPVPPVVTPPPVVAPLPPVEPVRTGTITTQQSTEFILYMRASKIKQFHYQVFDMATFNVVKDFPAAVPNSKGKFTLSDPVLYVNKKGQLGGRVLDAKGKVLLVHYPLTVVATK